MRMRHGFEVFKKCRAVIPGHMRAALDHVIARERADRDRDDVRDGELLCQRVKIFLQLQKNFFADNPRGPSC